MGGLSSEAIVLMDMKLRIPKKLFGKKQHHIPCVPLPFMVHPGDHLEGSNVNGSSIHSHPVTMIAIQT